MHERPFMLASCVLAASETPHEHWNQSRRLQEMSDCRLLGGGSGSLAPRSRKAFKRRLVRRTPVKMGDKERQLLALLSPLSGDRLEFPSQCTRTPTRSCDILDHLPDLNEVLSAIGAEVKEVALRKIAITDRKTLLRGVNFAGHIVKRGCLALHILLFNHHCVDTVDMMILHNLPRPIFRCLLWRDLQCASGVTCLELVKCAPTRALTSDIIVTVCRLLKMQLVRLTLHEIYLEGTTEFMLNKLTEAFRSSGTLRTLSISHVGHCHPSLDVRDEDARIDLAILDGLADNTCLTSLTMAFTYPEEDCVVALKRLLENTTTLTRLKLTHLAMHGTALSVKHITGAIAANRTLRSLTLKDLHLHSWEKRSLVGLLNSNCTLKDVKLLARRTEIEGSSAAQVPRLHVDALIKALEKAKSLERLVLNWGFSLHEIRRLAPALYGKALKLHLKEITLHQPEALRGILQGVPGSPNVVFEKCTFPEGSLLPVVPGTTPILAEQPLFSCTVYKLSLWDLCEVLAGNGGDITSLELRSSANLCAHTRRNLALYLACTRRLRRLDLNINDDTASMTAVIHGLAQNGSIEHLCLHATCEIDEKSVAVFSGWISTNTRLHTLDVSYRYSDTDLLVQALAKSLHRNYTLTSISLDAVNGPYYEHLRNLTWRNLGLLHCAAGFVLGCTQMCAAKAYSLLARHPLLRDAILQCYPLSENELRMSLRRAEIRRRGAFWRHAGIVRCKLECNESPLDGDGQVQLDEIGPYMLDHICSFLTLADVLYDHDEMQGWPGQYKDGAICRLVTLHLENTQTI
ncbi:hypothetical protein MTO96_020247 [Rhipicephalus appendiculatus]